MQRVELTEELVDLLREDTGAVIHIVGPAGSGKTTLVDHLVRTEDARGRAVDMLRGRRMESDLPWGTIRDLVGASFQHPVDAWEAIVQRAGSAPVTLVVDDAQWLDALSAATIAAAVSRAPGIGWNIVIASRPDGGGPLDMLSAGVRHVELLPLDEDDLAGALAAGSVVAPTDERVESLVAASAGWPGLAAALIEDNVGESEGWHSGPRVRSLVEGRLRSVVPDARMVAFALAFGAVPGSTAMSAASALDTEALDRHLSALHAEGLCDRVGFQPTPVAAVLRSLTPAGARARIAAALAEAGPVTRAALATYLAELGDRSAVVATLAIERGDSLVELDPEASVAAYRSAVDAGADPEQVRVKAARAALAAGRADDALRELGDETLIGPDAEVARLVTAAAWARLGRPADSAGAYAAAGGRTDPAAPWLGRFLALITGQPIGPAEEGASQLSPSVEAARRLALAADAWQRGQVDAAFAELDAAADLLEVRRSALGWPDLPHAVGVLLAASHDVVLGERWMESARRSGLGVSGFKDRLGALDALVAMRAGRLDDADKMVEDLLGAPGLRLRADRVVATAVRAGLLVRRREPDALQAAATEIGQAARAVPEDFLHVEITGELARAGARLGGLDAGLRMLAPAEHVAQRSGPLTMIAVLWYRALVGVAAEDLTVVADVADRLAQVHVDAPSGLVGGLALRAVSAFAEVLADRVDSDVVSAVAAELAAAGWHYEGSRLAGLAALRATDEDDARRLLRDSRSLRTTRVRVSSDSEMGDIVALSEREVEVARLVMSGRTHKEIGGELYISAKTVEHHVARIRQKLNATSRAEMMASLRTYLEPAA